MRIPQFQSRQRRLANMTPMIDVVFLLIIFFLVSSHLARRENELQLDLPLASSGEEQLEQTAKRITVNVLPDGQLQSVGATVSINQIEQRLRAARDREGQDVELRIRADRSVPYQNVSQLLAAAADCGIWNVKFAVVQGKR